MLKNYNDPNLTPQEFEIAVKDEIIKCKEQTIETLERTINHYKLILAQKNLEFIKLQEQKEIQDTTTVTGHGR